MWKEIVTNRWESIDRDTESIAQYRGTTATRAETASEDSKVSPTAKEETSTDAGSSAMLADVTSTGHQVISRAS